MKKCKLCDADERGFNMCANPDCPEKAIGAYAQVEFSSGQIESLVKLEEGKILAQKLDIESNTLNREEHMNILRTLRLIEYAKLTVFAVGVLLYAYNIA